MTDLRHRVAELDAGELTDMSAVYPYTIVFAGEPTGPMVYTTKKQTAWQLVGSPTG